MTTRAKWWLFAGVVAIAAIGATIYTVVHDLRERERLLDPLPRFVPPERGHADRPPLTDAAAP